MPPKPLARRWDPKTPGDYPSLDAYRLANDLGGVETLPHKYQPIDTFILSGPLHALADANKLGATNVTPEQIAAIFLNEQRRDLGSTVSDNDIAHNKRAVALKNLLMSPAYGYSDREANLAAVVADKQDTSERLGLPFAQVWNGTGPAAINYSDRFNMTLDKAVPSPKNATVLKFFRDNMTDPSDMTVNVSPVNHDPFSMQPVDHDPFASGASE